MPVVTPVVKAFAAFGNCKIVIITPCSSYIKKICSSLPRFNAFTVNALHFLFVIVVRHVYLFWLIMLLAAANIILFCNYQNFATLSEKLICRIFFAQLEVVKLGVITIHCKQFAVRAGFNNFALVKNKYLIERNG